MLYKDYLIQRKLQPLKDAGVLWKTPIDCPTDNDGTKLWTTAALSEVGEIGVQKLQNGDFNREVKFYFAICLNGHRHDL